MNQQPIIIVLFVFAVLLAVGMAVLIALGSPAIGIPLGVVAISLFAVGAASWKKQHNG